MAAITITGVRFSYCHLFQPKPPKKQGEAAKYCTTVLVPKANTAAKALIDQAVNQAIEDGVPKKWGGIRPPKIEICVYDGDGPRPSDGMPFGEECRGMWVFTAGSTDQPFVVDCQVQPIMRPQDVYSGMWGNVNVAFFAYENSGKKGIGCALNGVQKTGDDTPLSGGITAQDVFQVVAPGGFDATVAYPQTAAAPVAGGWGAPAAPAAPGVYPAAPAPGGWPTGGWG